MEQIRIGHTSDANQITSVINAAFKIAEGFFIDGDRITQPEVMALLDKGNFLVSENEGNMRGCVYVEVKGERAYLGLLSVDPSVQRSGLGSKLLAAGEEYCRNAGCKVMDIKIVNLRAELPEFYKKRGYEVMGTSPFPPDVETKRPCFFIDMSKQLLKGE